MREGKSGGVADRLWVVDEAGDDVEWCELERRRLRGLFEHGGLGEVRFRAVVFRANYPNSNFVRFVDGELDGIAESFSQVPFLRNHNTRDIDARGGIVESAWRQGTAVLGEVLLTVPRDVRAFVDGQIDRFSIGWYWETVKCSVCGADLLGRECSHWPGRRYAWQGGDVLCEAVFGGVRGKEVSAVNAPAVEGTGVEAVLAELGSCDWKREDMKGVKVSEVLGDEGTRSVPVRDGEGTSAEALTTNTPAEVGAWQEMLVSAAVEAEIHAAGLRGGFADVAREAAKQPGVTPSGVKAMVAKFWELQAEGFGGGVVQGHGIPLDGGRIGGMVTPGDRLQDAVDWLFGVKSAPLPAPSLRSLRDTYVALTGDGNFYGVFNPEWAQLAAVNSTTLTGMAVDAMNKVLIEVFESLAVYRWYEDLVSVQPNDGSTQDMHWISYGGTGDLPTVAEGAAYTEGTVTDALEDNAFVKKGRYVGITLEMFRKSQVAKVQAIPRMLAIDAIRTRSSAIAGLFTTATGTGPTLDQDSTVLFHTDHSNLATTALSSAAWKAARTECAKHAELGSSKRIGFYPKYCLVPIDLYDEALVIFGYGQGPGGYPGTGNNDVNPYAEARLRDDRPIPVKVPEWTDTNNWAYLVDPRLFPVIQMSYAQQQGGGSHPAPELFSVTSPESGLMFTNDVLPVKVRDWFAYGVSGYRGIGKRNVT